MRIVVADNLLRHMEAYFADKPHVGNRAKYLSEKAEVSLSTVQRTLSKETGASVDTIEALARVLGTSPYELLTPSSDLQKLMGIASIQRGIRGVVEVAEANPARKRSPG